MRARVLERSGDFPPVAADVRPFVHDPLDRYADPSANLVRTRFRSGCWEPTRILNNPEVDRHANQLEDVFDQRQFTPG